FSFKKGKYSFGIKLRPTGEENAPESFAVAIFRIRVELDREGLDGLAGIQLIDKSKSVVNLELS
ncbi:MAG: hypothetical protein ACI8UZ_001082, partial [Akkermansiaceae bacterium]